MNPSSVTQLDRDYLNALALLRPALDSRSVGHLIWPHIRLQAFEYTINARYLCAFDWVKDGSVRSLSIGVRPGFADLHQVERVEGLLYAAVVADEWIRHHNQIDQWSPSEQVHQFCISVGCLSQNEPDMRERWRKLHAVRHWATLPVVLAHESRPKCKICSGPVATGHERSNCHDECLRYAHMILLPAVRIAQAEKRAREVRENAASEVDK